MTQTRIITAETFDEIFEKHDSQDILNANAIYYPLSNGKFMCLKNRYGIDGIKTQSEIDNILKCSKEEYENFKDIILTNPK